MRLLSTYYGDPFLHLFFTELSAFEDEADHVQRLSRNMVYVDGESKLAKPLVKLVAISYTEQWSALAPAGVLM